MAQIFGAAKFPYNIMRTGCVAKDQTQCPLSKTISNVAHYSSELHRGHLGWPRSISFTRKASNSSAFSGVQLMNWIHAYMLNKLAHVGNNFGLKMLLIIFVHFRFESSWQLVHLLSCPPGEGGLQARWQSQQASGHGSPRQPSFHSRCSTITEHNHATLACSLFPALDITVPQGTAS